MSRALEGIKLAEFGSHHGAAYAAMLLAEQGADAIKVEPPGGAAERGSPHFHVINRSKRPLFLDLESKSAANEVAHLLRWADIVITAHTPLRLTALGLDYGSIRKINPRALVVEMPPLGSLGPSANLEAGEEIVQALGGIAGSQWARSGNPVPLTFPAASYSAGVMAAAAAVAGLIARGEGAGQKIEVSLLAGAFSLQTGSIMRHEKMTALYARAANDPLGPVPCYRLFEAGDGKFLFVACGNATFWNKFAIVIERPDLVADPRFDGAPWGIPPENWQTLKDILEPIMRTRSRDEWLRILAEGDVPCAPVLSRAEFIDSPQVRALAMRREVDDPALGPTVQMGIPIDLRDTPGAIVGPAPAIEQSASRAMAQTTAPDSPKPHPGEPSIGSPGSGPLAGIMVLDFASYIAGSYGPMILAQMGADVIKIESLEGDAFRNFGFGFLGWNQGKRGLALNLNAPGGRDIVCDLVKRADVVVENMRPGRMRKFGLDYATLSSLNPRLIYMSVTGFGNHGPEHNQPGFDPLLQARSGVMAAQGGHHGHPVYLTCAICDYGAAMLSAFGCILALRVRQISGRGQICETSLLQAAIAMQAGEFVFHDGRPDMENGDPEWRGKSALSRCYRCKGDQWLAVAFVNADQWQAMRSRCAAAADISFADAAHEPSEGHLSAILADYFATLDRGDAIRSLNAAGIPAAPVHRVRDLFDDPQVLANELVVELEHPQWGPVAQTALLAKFSATVPQITLAAPLLGEHTDEVLARYLGYDEARIAELKGRGIVR